MELEGYMVGNLVFEAVVPAGPLFLTEFKFIPSEPISYNSDKAKELMEVYHCPKIKIKLERID
jgi:hypothetical protein